MTAPAPAVPDAASAADSTASASAAGDAAAEATASKAGGLHFSAQRQPFLSLKLHETTQHIPRKALSMSRNVDVCEALLQGCRCRRCRRS